MTVLAVGFGPVAINNNGQVIGGMDRGGDYESESRPMLYSNRELYNLNCLIPPNSGWFLDEPNDINDVGQIVGRGIHDNLSHAFLLTPGASPTPTPGSYRVYLPAVLRK